MARGVWAVALAACAACAGGDDTAGDGSLDPTSSIPRSADDEAVAPSSSAPPTAPSTVAPPTTAPGPPPPATPDPACAPAPDRRITDLPDATIAAIVGEPVDVPALELDGGETIPAVHVPGISIPAQSVDGGCIIEFAAPGGCLGAVEMTAVTVPELRVPGFEIDAVVIDGEEISERIVRPPVVIAAASAPAVRLEQDCEIAPIGDTADLALVREELVRQAAIRPEGVRPGVRRPPICVDGDCSGELAVDDVVIPQASISEVVMPELVVLVQPVQDAPDAQVVEVPGQTSYTAPVDVLFDVEAAELRPDAEPSLQAIATEIARADPASRVTVEGHTDSDGEPAYNDDLSQRRAQAVTEWLVAFGGIAADRITTVGLGENVPVAANDTPEGRARNRRVVISVLDVP